jgi:hypothetical protein
MLRTLLCNEVFTFFVPCWSGTPKAEDFSQGNKKRPPESGFSEASFKEYLLQVLPKTSQPAHRQAGITTMASWRLYVLACVNEVVMDITLKSIDYYLPFGRVGMMLRRA